MSEEEKIIQHFLCICMVLFIIGLLLVIEGYRSTDSEIWIIRSIGFVMMSFSSMVFIDYGLHKLWHLEKT